MKKLMVSVFDKVAREHGEVILVNNSDVAERFFRQQVLNKVQNPDDYELYQHGYFHTETGIVEPIDNFENIVIKPVYQDLGD